MNLPLIYQWLAHEPAPRHLLKAVELYGVTEIVGSKNNPVILGWAKEVDLEKVYDADSIPWCGLFIATIMKRADREPVKDPLFALNWNNFGVKIGQPMLGDILTFTRKGGGHVGLYVGEDVAAYHVLGGNQGDKVSIVRIGKDRLSQVRRPAYNLQPFNIRKIKLAINGGLSTNEA
jgi:uncharacterized protein (TIGR02594 family)